MKQCPMKWAFLKDCIKNKEVFQFSELTGVDCT